MTDKQVVILAVPDLPQELFLRIGRRVVEELRRAEPTISWVILNGGLEAIPEEKLRAILRRTVPADWHGQVCADCLDYCQGKNGAGDLVETCGLFHKRLDPEQKACHRFSGRTWR